MFSFALGYRELGWAFAAGVMEAAAMFATCAWLLCPFWQRMHGMEAFMGWWHPLFFLFTVQGATLFLLQGESVPATGHVEVYHGIPFCLLTAAVPLSLFGNLWDSNLYSAASLPTRSHRALHRVLLVPSVIVLPAFVKLCCQLWATKDPTVAAAVVFPSAAASVWDPTTWDAVRGMEAGFILFYAALAVRLDASRWEKGAACVTLSLAFAVTLFGGATVVRPLVVVALVAAPVLVRSLKRVVSWERSWRVYVTGSLVAGCFGLARATGNALFGDAVPIMPPFWDGFNPAFLLAASFTLGAPLRWVALFRDHLPTDGWKPKTAAGCVCVLGIAAQVCGVYAARRGWYSLSAGLVAFAMSAAVVPTLPFRWFLQLFVTDFILVKAPWFHVYAPLVAYGVGSTMVATEPPSLDLYSHRLLYFVFLCHLPSMVHMLLFTRRWVSDKSPVNIAWLPDSATYTLLNNACCVVSLFYIVIAAVLGARTASFIRGARMQWSAEMAIFCICSMLFIRMPTLSYHGIQIVFAFQWLTVLLNEFSKFITEFDLGAFTVAASLCCLLATTVAAVWYTARVPGKTVPEYKTQEYSFASQLDTASSNGDAEALEVMTSWGLHTRDSATRGLRLSILAGHADAARMWIGRGARPQDITECAHAAWASPHVLGLGLECGVPASSVDSHGLLSGNPHLAMVYVAFVPEAADAVRAGVVDSLRRAGMESFGTMYEKSLEDFVVGRERVRRWAARRATYILPRPVGSFFKRSSGNISEPLVLSPDFTKLDPGPSEIYSHIMLLRQAACLTDRLGVLDVLAVAWEKHGGVPPPHDDDIPIGVVFADRRRAAILGRTLSLRRLCRTPSGGGTRGLVEPFGRDVTGYL